MKENFGISGTGEGVVWYPVGVATYSIRFFENYSFKTKGEEFHVIKQNAYVQLAPSIIYSSEEFADVFVTPARLKQVLVMVHQGND